MSRIRLLGPHAQLEPTLRLLQDFGRVQLDDVAPAEGLVRTPRDPASLREERYLHRLVTDAERALLVLGVENGALSDGQATRTALAGWARGARRWRTRAERLRAQREQLEDERALLQRYAGMLQAFRSLLEELRGARTLNVFGVTLASSERERVDRLARELRDELGVEVLVASRALPSGDLAVLIAVPVVARARMERALAGARIPEIPLPGPYASESLTDAAPKILDRLHAIPNELAALERTRRDLARESRDDLRRYRTAGYDRLAALAALDRSASTAHAFAVEGWLPSADVGKLRRQIATTLGDAVILEELTREEWRSGAPPVVLSNPRLFRPFERLTALMPLPRYGSIDPTPFVAVGFPMLFGMILGDVGYGAVLALLALVLRRGATPGSTRRNVADIALACAAFAVIFGVLFGELFGALGQRWFGLRPLLLDREHAIVAAIAAAVAIGLAHTLLGMLLGIITAARGEPRVAWSRAVQLVMMVLVTLALLAALRVLPVKLFSPFALAVLVGFPILLVIEGIVAPIEFFSTLASVLSYVRIMALGTASVLLATVANEMVGLFGSVVVGALFALLFHLVNFALGLVSPTLHALRLHYVEFFRQFYSPGGRRYEPFGHWRTQHGSTPLTESEA